MQLLCFIMRCLTENTSRLINKQQQNIILPYTHNYLGGTIIINNKYLIDLQEIERTRYTVGLVRLQNIPNIQELTYVSSGNVSGHILLLLLTTC